MSLHWNAKNADQRVKGRTVKSLAGPLVKLWRLRKKNTCPQSLISESPRWSVSTGEKNLRPRAPRGRRGFVQTLQSLIVTNTCSGHSAGDESQNKPSKKLKGLTTLKSCWFLLYLYLYNTTNNNRQAGKSTQEAQQHRSFFIGW